MTAPDLETPPNDGSLVRRRRLSRRRWFAIAGIATLGLATFVFVYFEPHTAFIDDEVNETIPGLDAVLAADETSAAETSAAETSAAETSAPAETAATTTTGPSAPTATTATTAAGVDASAVPAAPGNSLAAGIATAQATGQPVVLSSGEFFSGEHSTTGTALVIALPDGSVVVRFEGLDTSNGPDLRVVLSPDEASESWEYSDRLILEELKGNIGEQNYVLGADVDLTGYRSVVIWCERFSVAFGAAAIDVQA